MSVHSHGAASTRAWLAIAAPRERPRLRLLCIPGAGAGAGMYHGWHRAVGDRVEVVGLQPPGRERRYREPAFDDIEPLIAAMGSAVVPITRDTPYALFGHSLGALLAFELARALRRLGARPPISVWVSGRRAPHLPSRDRISPRLSDDELLAALTDHGCRHPALAGAMAELMLPTLRRDLQVSAGYRFAPGRPLNAPIVAIGGEEDASVPRVDLEGWAEHTTGPFSVELFPGGHFYLGERPEPLMRRLAEWLAPHVEAGLDRDPRAHAGMK